MFFTQLGRIVAVLAMIWGLLSVGIGVSIAVGDAGSIEQDLAKYAGKATTGELIDSGIYKILFGIAFGMLAEIRIAQRGE